MHNLKQKTKAINNLIRSNNKRAWDVDTATLDIWLQEYSKENNKILGYFCIQIWILMGTPHPPKNNQTNKTKTKIKNKQTKHIAFGNGANNESTNIGDKTLLWHDKFGKAL